MTTGFEFEFTPDSGSVPAAETRRRQIRVWPQADGEGFWLEERRETKPGSDAFYREGIEAITAAEFSKIERPALDEDAPAPARATSGGPRDD